MKIYLIKLNLKFGLIIITNNSHLSPMIPEIISDYFKYIDYTDSILDYQDYIDNLKFDEYDNHIKNIDHYISNHEEKDAMNHLISNGSFTGKMIIFEMYLKSCNMIPSGNYLIKQKCNDWKINEKNMSLALTEGQYNLSIKTDKSVTIKLLLSSCNHILATATEKKLEDGYLYEFPFFNRNKVLPRLISGPIYNIIIDDICNATFESTIIYLTKEKTNTFQLLKSNEEKYYVIGHMWMPTVSFDLKNNTVTVNEEKPLHDEIINIKRAHIARHCISYMYPFYLDKLSISNKNSLICKLSYFDKNASLLGSLSEKKKLEENNGYYLADDQFFCHINELNKITHIHDLSNIPGTSDGIEIGFDNIFGSGCSYGIIQNNEIIDVTQKIPQLPVVIANWYKKDDIKGFYFQFINNDKLIMYRDNTDIVVKLATNNDLNENIIYKEESLTEFQKYERSYPGPHKMVCITGITQDYPQCPAYAYTDGLAYLSYPASMHYRVQKDRVDEFIKNMKDQGFCENLGCPHKRNDS